MACDDSAGTLTRPTNRELWALALHVEREYGAAGPVHIAERIGAAAIAGEWNAVAMWKAVAVRYDELLSQSARHPL